MGTSQMKKMSNIPLNLLTKGICLSIPPSVTWSGNISNIENILKEHYVLEIDTEKKYAEIAGLEEEECPIPNEQMEYADYGYFYIWCIFHYTYRLAELDHSQWMKFIWVSILLPYFHLLNKFGAASLEVLQQMLIDYPVLNHEGAVEDALKKLSNLNYPIQKANYAREICTIISSVGGINELLPSRGQIDAAVDIANAGLAVAISIAKNRGIT